MDSGERCADEAGRATDANARRGGRSGSGGEARGLAGGQTYRGGTGSRVAGGRKRAWRRRCKRQDQITPSATNSTRALHIGQLTGNWGLTGTGSPADPSSGSRDSHWLAPATQNSPTLAFCPLSLPTPSACRCRTPQASALTSTQAQRAKLSHCSSGEREMGAILMTAHSSILTRKFPALLRCGASPQPEGATHGDERRIRGDLGVSCGAAIIARSGGPFGSLRLPFEGRCSRPRPVRLERSALSGRPRRSVNAPTAPIRRQRMESYA